MRNLKWLNFRVPLAIVNKAHQANQLYPFAISLIESVRTFERTSEKVCTRRECNSKCKLTHFLLLYLYLTKVEEKNSISPLVAGLKKDVQGLITEVYH